MYRMTFIPFGRGTQEFHQYNENEMAEVFGSDFAKVERQGFLKVDRGMWIDMGYAALHLYNSLLTDR